MLIPAASISVIFKKSYPTVKSKKSTTKDELTDKSFLPRKPFLTAYRGGMLIITALAILAVDFNVFPRRFAKVETWGTSLMDLGVGSFVFSMGIVSTRSIILNAFNGKSQSYTSRVWKSITSSITSLLMGFLRVFFVKQLDYQEHVSEYGVHWNFFITLVLVGPLTIIIEPIFNYIPRSLVSIIISITYEWFIVNKEGFLSFLLISPRTDFVSANREGIFSLIGYLAIFLAGQSTGYYLLPSISTKNNLFKLSTKSQIIEQKKQKFSVFDKLTTVSPLAGLAIWFLIYTGLFKLTQSEHDFNVSRRLANFPYVVWVCSYNTGFLFLYSLIDKLLSNPNEAYSDRISVSLDSINSNGMIIFLLANISTGSVNILLNTLDASVPVSMAVMIGYASWVAVVGGLLYYKKVTIKL
jgi:phosphatidylinositol glycan class W